jgi:hypothetical protein
MAVRPTPFALVFGTLAGERFPAIRDALARAGADPRDRDVFLLDGAVVQLLRDLRPDDGVGEAMDQLVAFVQHAYLWWSAGSLTLAAEGAGFERLVSADAAPPVPAEGDATLACYVELPLRKVWGKPVDTAPYEPLDGVSLHHAPGGALRVLGVFGLHEDRLALTVVEVAGARPAGLVRPDGTRLFAPALPGGDAAGLHTLVGAEELLELGWRARTLAAAGAAPVA